MENLKNVPVEDEDSDSPTEIISIIPARDYYAVYEEDDGNREYYPVICFALVSDGETRFIAGVDITSDPLPGTIFCHQCSNFLGYAYTPNRRRSYYPSDE